MGVAVDQRRRHQPASEVDAITPGDSAGRSASAPIHAILSPSSATGAALDQPIGPAGVGPASVALARSMIDLVMSALDFVYVCTY